MKPTRLAIVTTHPVQYYAPLFRRLAERGRVDIHVFYGHGGERGAAHDPGFGRAVAWDIPLLSGYGHTFVPNRSADPGPHHFRGIDTPALPAAIRDWGADAVLVFGWAYRGHLAALRSFHGRIPVLFRGDSTLLDERPGPKRWMRRAVLRWVYRHVDLALYVGTRNREYFERHGVTGERLAWAPHAIENERFRDPTGDRAREAAEWRRSMSIGPEERVVLYAGKLEPVKNPGLLLEAFLEGVGESAHLVFAGSGPLEAELASAAGGHPRIHFIGFQNQSRMPTVYRLGDVVVLPSKSETWGLAVNEAMASGRPVVVSDRVGCAADLVRDGVNVYVVPSGDRVRLRDAIALLLGDDESRTRMGAASEEMIRAWSIEEAARRIEGAVVALVGGGSVEASGLRAPRAASLEGAP